MMPEEIVTVEVSLEAPLYHKRNLTLVRGAGAKVWDAEGRCYIDCIGGQGVAIVGHANTKVVAAICQQASDLLICPPFFHNPARATLLQQLEKIMPKGMGRFFLCNSGTESVEAALKFARLSTGRSGIVAAKRAFHGRTMGALSATYRPEYRVPFEPLVPNFTHVPFNDISAMEEAVGQETAAVILEPVQGEAGVYPAEPGYLQAVEDICRARGALLIIDEVQTGFGRTGKMFAFEHHGITPDLVCMAKGIAGGVPMGAVALGPGVENIKPGSHGSTFGGNPLSCAAAGAAIDYILTNKLPERAARLGAALKERLQGENLRAVRQVRGQGLMIGIELRFRNGPYLARLQEAGVLAMGAGPQVIRLLPPLVIDEEDWQQVQETLVTVLSQAEGG